MDEFASAPNNINLTSPEKLQSHLGLTCNLTSHSAAALSPSLHFFLSPSLTQTLHALSLLFLLMTVMSHTVHLNVKY